MIIWAFLIASDLTLSVLVTLDHLIKNVFYCAIFGKKYESSIHRLVCLHRGEWIRTPWGLIMFFFLEVGFPSLSMSLIVSESPIRRSTKRDVWSRLVPFVFKYLELKNIVLEWQVIGYKIFTNLSGTLTRSRPGGKKSSSQESCKDTFCLTEFLCGPLVVMSITLVSQTAWLLICNLTSTRIWPIRPRFEWKWFRNNFVRYRPWRSQQSIWSANSNRC